MIRSSKQTHKSGEGSPSSNLNERRASGRVAVQLPVRLSIDGISQDGLCTDLGVGGMFVEVQLGQKYGMAVTADVEFAAPVGSVRVSGVVRWTTDKGFGMQFDSVGARATHAIALVIGKSRRHQ